MVVTIDKARSGTRKDYQKAGATENQRLPKYRQNDEWIKDFLIQGKTAHIGHRSGEQVFVTPTSYWYEPEHNCLYFHSNLVGRTRSNLEHYPEVCAEVSEMGQFLPANSAVEFSQQYRSVMMFGSVRIVDTIEEKRYGLTGLLEKYFPDLTSGVDYRPITEKELARTSVYCLQIGSWSGKENWNKKAVQRSDWPSLPDEIFQRYSRTTPEHQPG